MKKKETPLESFTRMKREAKVNKILSSSMLSVSLLSETIYLLRISQPENCSKWVEGIGDCGKESCNFCRIEKCITELEGNDR